MKILFVAPWVPTTVRPRSRRIIEILARHHEVHVVCVAWSEDDVAQAWDLPAASVRVVRQRPLRGALRAARAVGSGRSLQQAYVSGAGFATAIRDARDELSPQLAYFNVIRSCQYLDLVDGIPVVVDLDEVRSGYYAQVQQLSGSLAQRAVARIERPRMAAAEALVRSRADAVLMSSPGDLAFSTRTSLVRSPHDMSIEVSSSSIPQRRPEIVFVGRLSYRANVEAATWFVRAVLPGVVERRPTVTVKLVGARPGRAIRQLEGPHVQVIGPVADVGEHYRTAAVSVVPVQMATGVQMKLIESLAAGTPTVATSKVATAAGVVDGRECRVADTPSAWVEALMSVLEGGSEVAAMAERGRRWAVRHHGDEAVEAAVLGAIAAASSGGLTAIADGRAGNDIAAG